MSILRSFAVLFCAASLASAVSGVPTQPVVTDDGAATAHVHRLHASWSATDPGGTIARYDYAVGYAPYPDAGWDAATGGWRNVGLTTDYTVTDIVLSPARTYYFSVRAVNTASQVGPVGVSDGIRLALPSPRTFTTTDDFQLGEMTSVVATPPDQLQLGLVSQTEPYIWIANHTIGQATKMDTRTGAILAQYYSTLPPNKVLPDNLAGQAAIPSQGSNQQSPSRTAVDLDGNVYVANRAHISANQQGSVTKIAGALAYAMDRNGNGRIDTSTGYGNLLSEDECVLWTAKVGKPGTIPRGVAVDAQNHVWVGTYADSVLYRFNGETGELMQTIDLKAETGQTTIQVYGLAIGRDGAIYSTSLDSKWNTRTDPGGQPGSRTRATQTFFSNYGIAVDRDGVEWVGRWDPSGETALQSVDWRTDPPTIHYHPSPYGGRTRGVAIDGNGYIWVAHWDSNRLLKFSPTGVYLTSYTVASGPIGVAVDSEGKIWAVGGSSNTCTRIDPVTGDRADFTAGGEPYSYSDMTGFQLRNFAARQGNWTVVCDGGGYGAAWQRISWNADVPAGALFKVEARASESTAGLAQMPWTAVSSGEPLTGVTGRFLEVKATLRIVSGEESPVLYDLMVDTPIPGPPPGVVNIPQAKQSTVGRTVRIQDKKVTYTGAGFFYMEEPNRCSGIRVESPDHVFIGDSVVVMGRAATVDGEAKLLGGTVISAAAGTPLDPLHVGLSRIGGSAFGLQPGTGPNGLNNTGLFISAVGRVTSTDANYIYVDDGSVPTSGLRIHRDNVAEGLVESDYVNVEGISRVVMDGATLVPTILPSRIRSAFGADEFDSSTLASYWTMIRPDAAYWSLTSDPGFLRLDSTGTDIWQYTNNLKNLVLRPIPGTKWRIETVVTATPTQNWQQGGILVYQNDDNYVRFEFQYSNRVEVGYVKEIAAGTSGVGVPVTTTTVQLRIDRDDSNYSLYWKLPSDAVWTKMVDLTSVPLTSPSVGLFSLKGSGVGPPYIPFLFDYFRWTTY